MSDSLINSKEHFIVLVGYYLICDIEGFSGGVDNELMIGWYDAVVVDGNNCIRQYQEQPVELQS